MADYIMDLRKIVGKRTLLQVGASVILEDSEGRMLLEKRTDNLCWGYAGGSTELDEQVEEAAKRELFEETGLIAKRLELFGVFSGPQLHYTYPNGDDVSNVDVVFLCREYEGELCMQESEVSEIRFFAADEMPPMDEISPPIRIPVQQWINEKLHKDQNESIWKEQEEAGMTVNEYQRLAMTTLNPELDKKDVLINSVMGLCGESGEAIDIVKKWLAQGHDLDREHLLKELGDVAWYLAEAATVLDVSLESIFAGNIAKLKKRYPEGFDTKCSRERAVES